MEITFLQQCLKPKMCYNVSISQEFRSKVCLSVTYLAAFLKIFCRFKTHAIIYYLCDRNFFEDGQLDLLVENNGPLDLNLIVLEIQIWKSHFSNSV